MVWATVTNTVTVTVTAMVGVGVDQIGRGHASASATPRGWGTYHPALPSIDLRGPGRSPALNPTAGRFLAFDTSTDRLSVGLAAHGRLWLHEGPGAAQSSATLIPAVLDLLGQAELGLAELDAIAFGRGPGSFTGLRTACAVAQGLAAGAGVPVLPVDTLQAVAEEASQLQAQAGQPRPQRVLALLDARMDEVYAQAWQAGAEPLSWQAASPVQLLAPEQLASAGWAQGCSLAAGNAFEPCAGRLALPAGCATVQALPTAAALLRLAPGLWAAGRAVPAHEALPLYVRDKVAQTTEERLAAKAAAQG